MKDIIKRCPSLKDYDKGNYSACVLDIKFETERAASITLAVQYAN
jgi:hypothetical protein